MDGWRTNELKEEGKIGQNHPFYHLATWVAFVTMVWEYDAPAKSEKPKFTWSVTEEGLITIAWLSAVLSGEHADLLGISGGLLAQKNFCVVHVLCTYLFAFSLSSVPAFCYGICFDMEGVSPVIHNPQNYSCNSNSFEEKGTLRKLCWLRCWWLLCLCLSSTMSLLTWKTQYNLRWIGSLCFS